MTAKTDQGTWINMVGTYGVASAQLYWGRMAALVLRILYHMFPSIYWAFVYVDDYMFLIRTAKRFGNPWRAAAAILLVLQATGFPLSWKKTVMSYINTWLGFQFDSLEGTIYLAPPKQIIITEICNRFTKGEQHSLDEAMTAIGRLQWCTGAYPHLKPFLQPFYAWMNKLKTVGVPGKRCKLLAYAILNIINKPPASSREAPATSKWMGASDAGADTDRAVVGGWISLGHPHNRHEVWWFCERLNPVEHRWAFRKKDAKRQIAAIELYGTLLLAGAMIDREQAKVPVYLPMETDNQGNAYAVLGKSTRRWPNAAILMELMVQALCAQITPEIRHVKRDLNTWADQLTHEDFTGFDPAKRVDVSQMKNKWKIIPKVLPPA